MSDTNSTHTEEMDQNELLEAVNSAVLNELSEEETLENEAVEADLTEDSQSEEIQFPETSELEYPEVEEVQMKVEEQFNDYSGESSNNENFELELDYLDDQKQEDKLWQARTGLNYDTLCGAIETIIFMSDKPISLAKIKAHIDEDLPLRVIHEALARLQDEYETTHHGIRLQEVAEGYQFRTKATYSKYVQDLFKVNELVLSPTALEVLAIISYKQPVSKVEVEKIRGVDSSHIVRGLIDKRLVKVVGRSDEVGKPVLYGTTTEFLEVFNLANLDQLPPEHELEEMAKSGVGKIADIKTIVHKADSANFTFDELDELDKLSDSIKEISSETAFTQSLKVEEKKRKTEEGVQVKSAFDLLEEFVNAAQVEEVNREAVISEPFTAITHPQVINDLTAGPFNEPELIDEEEEEFQMIDLDTGEPIIFDDEEEFEVEVDEDFEKELQSLPELPVEIDEAQENSLEAALNAFEEDELVVENEVEIEVKEEVEVSEKKVENLFGEGADEVKSLAAALDQAFANLTGETLSSDESDLEEGSEAAKEKEESLADLTDKIVSEGNDLDLDLTFLQDSENTTQDSTNIDE